MMCKFLDSLLVLPGPLFAQNVGIGVADPTKGRPEVVNGSGELATAIFGTNGAGMSLDHNWPRLGFNIYWPGNGKYDHNWPRLGFNIYWPENGKYIASGVF